MTNITTTPTDNAAGAPDTFQAGRDMPKGSIHCHIDCAGDPSNILAPAQEIVKAIESCLATLEPGQKLAVLFGEAHVMPNHSLLQQEVMELLRKNPETQNFTVNFERPHNSLFRIAEEGAGINIPKALKYSCGDYDDDRAEVLSAYLGYCVFSGAHISESNRLAYCYENRIDVKLNDAARNGDCLDLNDPVTASVAKLILDNLGSKDVSTCSPDGVAIRNAVMAKLSLAHANAQGFDIILQSAGLAHVLGHAEGRFPYKDSLTARFKASGTAVLSIVITMEQHGCGLNILPEDASDTLRDNGIVIDGLGDDIFNGNDLSAESNYIKEINAASGGVLEVFDVAGRREQYRQKAKNHINALVERYQQSL